MDKRKKTYSTLL